MIPPPHPIWYRFTCFLARNLIYGLTGGIRAYGRENVPASGPLLIAPNHLSHLDPPATAVMCPRMLRFMAKEELFRGRLTGWLLKSWGAFPIHRGSGDLEAIRTAMQCLADGQTLLVFPEGTRGDGQMLGPVNRGIAMLAKRADAAVVPVALLGTFEKMPRGKSLPGWGRVVVAFGEPFRYAELAPGGTDAERRNAFGAEWSRQIVEMQRRYARKSRTASCSPGSTTPDPR